MHRHGPVVAHCTDSEDFSENTILHPLYIIQEDRKGIKPCASIVKQVDQLSRETALRSGSVLAKTGRLYSSDSIGLSSTTVM